MSDCKLDHARAATFTVDAWIDRYVTASKRVAARKTQWYLQMLDDQAAIQTPPPPVPVPGVFVSPTGSDTTGDGSILKPYATLIHARAVMRFGGPQLCWVRGGIHPVPVSETLSGATFGLRLTATDSGQTYKAFEDEKPILDCSNVKVGLAADGASNVTFDGLELHGFKWVGIGVHGGEHFYEIWPQTTPQAKGNTIRNCIARDGSTDTAPIFGYGGAPIYGIGNIPQLTIVHNAIHNAATGGISIAAGNAGGSQNLEHLYIGGNAVTKVCQGVTDAGAVYVQDVYANSVGISIHDNYVRDLANGRGIYLDDGTSNADIYANYIAGLCGIAATVHGGRNVNWRHEIIDAATPGATILRVQKSSVVTDMAGIKFTGNTVISNGQPRYQWIDPGVTVEISGTTINPHPYPVLPGGYGPPGYVIPAGTPPSYA